jgi:hypothetical protein
MKECLFLGTDKPLEIDVARLNLVSNTAVLNIGCVMVAFPTGTRSAMVYPTFIPALSITVADRERYRGQKSRCRSQKKFETFYHQISLSDAKPGML